jgi:FemAB-related protein (PEP-CTERM system-associated)
MTSPQTSLAPKMLVAPLSDSAEWDGFVANAPGATIAHLHAWSRITADVMRKEPRYLAAWDADGSIRGVLPLVRLRSLAFGERYVSVPYLNDGGPIGDPEAVVALRAYALEHECGPSARLELRCRVPLEGNEPSGHKVTVLLDLPPEPATLWDALPSKVRSQVRRPTKAGMTMRFGVDQLSAFYDVWSHNMRDLGTPVLPRRFFDAVATAFPDHFIVGCVYREDEPVAAGAGFLFRDEFEITWASSLRAHSREAPNMLLYWEFMSRAIERGATVFNFGRCTPGESTHKFKLQWGGESVPLGWEVHGASATGNGGPGHLARMASSAWRRLPLPVANLVGPVMARQLPWW